MNVPLGRLNASSALVLAQAEGMGFDTTTVTPIEVARVQDVGPAKQERRGGVTSCRNREDR